MKISPLILLLCFVACALFGAQTVRLDWTPSVSTNATGTRIYMGGASGVYTNTYDAGSASELTISNLTVGATYFFAATAYDDLGDESGYSNEAEYIVPSGASGAHPVIWFMQ